MNSVLKNFVKENTQQKLGILYKRVHEDSNLTDSVQRLDSVFRFTHKLPQTAFRASGSHLKKPVARTDFSK